MRRALACFLVIGVAGCSGGIMNAQYDGPELKVAALASHQVDDKDLLVKIPEWSGRIESARQTNNSSGVKQEIVVSGGTRGDNFVEVAVETGGVRNVDGFAKAHAPSSEDIDEELKARFPGVAMRAIPVRGQLQSCGYTQVRSPSEGMPREHRRERERLRLRRMIARIEHPAGLAAETGAERLDDRRPRRGQRRSSRRPLGGSRSCPALARGRRAHSDGESIRSSSSAFCACRRFSA